MSVLPPEGADLPKAAETSEKQRYAPAQPHGGFHLLIQLSGVALSGRSDFLSFGPLPLRHFSRRAHVKVDFPPLSYTGTLVCSSFIGSFPIRGVWSYRCTSRYEFFWKPCLPSSVSLWGASFSARTSFMKDFYNFCYLFSLSGFSIA